MIDVTAIEPDTVCAMRERLGIADGWTVRRIFVAYELPVMHYIRMTQRSSHITTRWGKDRATGDFVLRDTPQGRYLTIQKQVRSVIDVVMARNGIAQIGKSPIGFEGQIRLMKHSGHKPDIDNAYKGLFDCLNGCLWLDDAWVTEYSICHRPLYVKTEAECGFEAIITEFLTPFGLPFDKKKVYGKIDLLHKFDED